MMGHSKPGLLKMQKQGSHKAKNKAKIQTLAPISIRFKFSLPMIVAMKMRPLDTARESLSSKYQA